MHPSHFIPVHTHAALRSISDDDLCSDCAHRSTVSHGLSMCSEGWPGTTNEDDYVISCTLREER